MSGYEQVDSTRIRKSLRNMAIERAKGELRSILGTYWDTSENYDRDEKAVEKICEMIDGELG